MFEIDIPIKIGKKFKINEFDNSIYVLYFQIVDSTNNNMFFKTPYEINIRLLSEKKDKNNILDINEIDNIEKNEQQKNSEKLTKEEFLKEIKKEVGELFNENQLKGAYEYSKGNIAKAIDWLYTQEIE